ncbi:MAG: hypothetical protein JSW33_14345 [bacterium]|nr:MAG: hypothetical protein JSW33_14345 [bacterium]
MKKSRLSSVVSIAEIVSSLAIVVSLFYVAYEFKRSNTLTNRDVENIIYSRMLEMDRLIIERTDLAKLILKASGNSEKLTPDEKLRYLAFEHIFYDSWESAWYYHHEGILEKQNWDGWNSWFISETKNKPFLSWEGNRKNYSREFLEYVDNIFNENMN